MEQQQQDSTTNTNQNHTTKTTTLIKTNGTTNSYHQQHQHHQYYQQYHHQQHQNQLQQYSTQLGFFNNKNYQRYYPALLPLPSLQQLPLIPSFPQNHNFKLKTHLHKLPCKLNTSPSSDYNLSQLSLTSGK
jgi:eukaryotic translation initiation factor 2C